MVGITIMAVVDDTIACVQLQVDKLDWISVDAARVARVDSLPYRIVDVTICTDKGVFRQVFPALVEELEERTSWWKRWWRELWPVEDRIE